MDRLFSALMVFALLCALMTFAPMRAAGSPELDAQPVFFSMLFPQLTPQGDGAATPGEAVVL